MIASGQRAGRLKSRFRRILVVLDSTPESLLSVDSVAALAARLEAEMLGLFIEDINLVRLAEHPEIGTLGTVSAGLQPARKGALRRSLKVQVAESRSAVENAARRRSVKSSFEVRRGQMAAEVVASAESADLVIIRWTAGHVSMPPSGPWARPGSIARAVAERAVRSVLLLRPDVAISGPALVAYDGSKAAEDALATAAEIAEEEVGGVVVMLLTGHREEAERWQEHVNAVVGARGLRARFVRMAEAGLDDLCQAARQSGAAILVLGSEQAFLRGEAGPQLLDRIACSVLVVR